MNLFAKLGGTSWGRALGGAKWIINSLKLPLN
jgi:hypothetical protein